MSNAIIYPPMNSLKSWVFLYPLTYLEIIKVSSNSYNILWPFLGYLNSFSTSEDVGFEKITGFSGN